MARTGAVEVGVAVTNRRRKHGLAVGLALGVVAAGTTGRLVGSQVVSVLIGAGMTPSAIGPVFDILVVRCSVRMQFLISQLVTVTMRTGRRREPMAVVTGRADPDLEGVGAVGMGCVAGEAILAEVVAGRRLAVSVVRITSYNVCYTKLLRGRRRGRSRAGR